jgi:hypothetical protein
MWVQEVHRNHQSWVCWGCSWAQFGEGQNVVGRSLFYLRVPESSGLLPPPQFSCLWLS